MCMKRAFCDERSELACNSPPKTDKPDFYASFLVFFFSVRTSEWEKAPCDWRGWSDEATACARARQTQSAYAARFSPFSILSFDSFERDQQKNCSVVCEISRGVNVSAHGLRLLFKFGWKKEEIKINYWNCNKLQFDLDEGSRAWCELIRKRFCDNKKKKILGIIAIENESIEVVEFDCMRKER